MGSNENRKKALHRIVQFINVAGAPVKKDKLIASLMYDEGITDKTALSYLDTLIKAELIDENQDGDIISLNPEISSE